MAGRHEKTSSTAALVDYLSLIPLGNYDKFHQFMERSGNDVENLGLPAKVFASAIERHRDGRRAEAKQCLHNAAVLQGCVRAKRDWREYLIELKERDSDSSNRLVEDIEKLRARLPEAVDNNARQQQDSLRQATRQDQSTSLRHQDAALSYRVRDSRVNEEDERQASQQSQDHSRPAPVKGASAKPTKAFIPGNNIHPDLIGPWARKHVGSDAVVEKSTNAGREGYLVTAGRIPTSEMLGILIEDSKKRFNSEPRYASTQSRIKSDPVPGRHSAYPAVRYRDDNRPPAQYRSSPMERASRPDEDDRIEVHVRPQSISVTGERHGTQSTAARSRKESQDMTILANVAVSSRDYSDKLQVDWAELDHGMYGACDNLISLKCFREMSGGVEPEGRSTKIFHGHNPNFVTDGIAISLDVSWEGGKAINQGFVVDMAPDCTAGVVLGKRIIDKYELLDLARKKRVPDSGDLWTYAHKVHTIDPRDKPPDPRPGTDRPNEPRTGNRRPTGH